MNIKSAGTDEMFRLLDHNEADIVCTLDNHIYNTAYKISDEEIIGIHFIVRSNHPLTKKDNITLEDLLVQPFLLTEKGMSYRRLLDDKLAEKSIENKPILEMGSADLICKLVEKDMGISFLPDYVTEKSANEGKLVRLEVSEFEIELWKQLLYHKDKWVSVQMRVVIDFLKKIKLT